MQTITAQPVKGIHCESCGAADPATDDGYTTCCNELTCWGSGQGFGGGARWAIENPEREVIAVVRDACCGFVAFQAANAALGDRVGGGHLDCSGCEVHTGRRF